MRRCRTRSGRPIPVNSAISSSVNPITFAARSRSDPSPSASRSACSIRNIRSNARMNQMSIPDSRVKWSGESPVRNLNISFQSRVSSPVRSGTSALSPRQTGSSQVSDFRPSSSERTAFNNADSKLRSIAITSPVAFICVPNDLSPVANLSNGHRGIFTTQ